MDRRVSVFALVALCLGLGAPAVAKPVLTSPIFLFQSKPRRRRPGWCSAIADGASTPRAPPTSSRR